MNNDRSTAAQRGYGYKWQKYREGYKLKHPLCIKCKDRGVVRAMDVVDHIIAPRLDAAKKSGDPVRIAAATKLFWDPKNHQPLCFDCHDRDKQRLEKSGTVAGCDESGVPVDANHHWNAKH